MDQEYKGAYYGQGIKITGRFPAGMTKVGLVGDQEEQRAGGP
jgi:hypothetical protein